MELALAQATVMGLLPLHGASIAAYYDARDALGDGRYSVSGHAPQEFPIHRGTPPPGSHCVIGVEGIDVRRELTPPAYPGALTIMRLRSSSVRKGSIFSENSASDSSTVALLVSMVILLGIVDDS